MHVSATEAVAELARARDEGLNVFGETCPQYLFLSTDNLAEPDFEGAKYVCSTPLRPKEHQAALWRGLRTNDLQVVSTDHCPFCFTGQKELGRGDFSKIPNGLPGVENRMDLLHQAVLDGHITRRRWIEIACATPARMFGLYPKKGTIAPGADADVVIYDPHAEQVMSADTHHMNVDYSAYEGKRVTGRVETVFSRGVPVVTGREYTGHAGHGVYTPAFHLSVPHLGAERMDFGLVLQTDPPASRVISLMKRAERNGFTHGWTFDSAVLWQEPFVIYSQILANTTTLEVGPMVTNPGTRTWEVTASTFATLNDMYGNRTVCGIGRGDSAMRVAGRRPNTLARLGEAIDAIRDLAEGREAEVDGQRMRLPWVRDGRLPVWMAAYGPKALALTGRKADGFILQLADPFLTEWMVKAVRNAAAEAGRDPDAITVCVAAPAYVGDDLAHAREQCRWFGGMVGNHVADLVARYGEHSGMVPEALTEYIKGREGYDYSHHGRVSNPSTDFVPDEIVDRFCLLGPPEAHIEKLRALRDLGVDQFAVYDMHDAQETTIDAYGAEIIPALGD